MQNRSRLLAVLAGAFVATPLVVMAASSAPAPVVEAVAAKPAGPAMAAAPAVVEEARPLTCGRKVRVVYGSYQLPANPACGAS